MKKVLTPGQKAAHTKKWRRASTLAHKRCKDAKTFTKYALGKIGFKCVNLDSKKGYEYKGAVDLVAVKRDRKDSDKLNIVFVQVKGGTAKVSLKEITRLKKAVKKACISWNVAEKPKNKVMFKNPI